MIVAMAGLPGTGKSSLARELARRTGGVLYDKDTIREFLFPGGLTDFSEAQNDLCTATMFHAAEYLAAGPGSPPVFLDGRTFARRAQVDMLLEALPPDSFDLRVIECVCSEETARARIEGDLGKHVARNRDFALYLEIKRSSEPIAISHLVLDTDGSTLEETVEAALKYLGRRDV